MKTAVYKPATALRFLQAFSATAPPCDIYDCIDRGQGLYADSDNRGWVLCLKHLKKFAPQLLEKEKVNGV